MCLCAASEDWQRQQQQQQTWAGNYAARGQTGGKVGLTARFAIVACCMWHVACATRQLMRMCYAAPCKMEQRPICNTVRGEWGQTDRERARQTRKERERGRERVRERQRRKGSAKAKVNVCRSFICISWRPFAVTSSQSLLAVCVALPLLLFPSTPYPSRVQCRRVNLFARRNIAPMILPAPKKSRHLQF